MKNPADQGGCYPQRSKAEVDSTVPRSAESIMPFESRSNLSGYCLSDGVALHVFGYFGKYQFY